MIEIINNDCLIALRGMADNSVDAVVTDPPAGISFMSKSWDSDKGGRDNWIKWLSDVFIEVRRVLKPGGHCFVWALPRTSHWTAFSLENAGFDVRDCVYHIFGSGFPKSFNLGDGWGTALKPAVECWWLIRKPLAEKTIALNVLKWGTGGLNIDGCRVEYQSDNDKNSAIPQGRITTKVGAFAGRSQDGKDAELNREDWANKQQGRFPANVIHDGSEEVLAGFPYAKSGAINSEMEVKSRSHFNPNNDDWKLQNREASSGSASRFFYCAKSSRSERNKGLDEFEEKIYAPSNQAKAELKRGNTDFNDWRGKPHDERNNFNHVGISKNNHPTVKPVSLMRYLCKLITPPKGIILDPFMGSGSTGIGAKLEGFSFIGIEKDEEYCKIAEARIKAWEEEKSPKEIIEPTLF